MRVLHEANETVLEALAEFRNSSLQESLRLIRYVVFAHVESGILMHNTLTKEIVLLEPCDNIYDNHFLQNLWLVPQDFDDSIIATKYRDWLFSTRPKTLEPNGYTVATTTDCNARCFYCYEMGLAKKKMTNETAIDVADYMAKNYFSAPEEKRRTISISWFGGEPLYNKEAIKAICNRLRELGVPYVSTAISNGFLFDEPTIAEAKWLWRLKRVQITIDGTEKKYNKAKNYKEPGENPFETVLNNIDNLSKNRISVNIRVNVGYYNRDDILSLIDIISTRFKGRENVKMYVHSLFDTCGVTDVKGDEKEKAVYEAMKKMGRKLSELGINAIRPLNLSVKGAHCMADNGKHVVIQTDGKLCLCEHYVDSKHIGSIYSDEFDEKMIEHFREITEPFSNCYKCQIFPSCSYVKVCEDNSVRCSKYRQDYKISNVVLGLEFIGKQLTEEKK